MPRKKAKKSKLALFPCTCGHSKQRHYYAGPSIGDQWCESTIARSGLFRDLCECEHYTPDNLKYIEKRYKDKHKKRK